MRQRFGTAGLPMARRWLVAALAALALVQPSVPIAAQQAKAGPLSIAVIGDSIARHYCRGLKRHLARDDRFRIECWVHPSSGLTRDDFLDWDAKLADYLARDPVDVAIVSMGANDAQRMVLPGRVLDFGKPDWDEAYGARIDRFIERLKDAGAEVVWVGLPIPRSDSFATKLDRLNTLYRAHAATAGAAFVPLWQVTQDETGRYAAALPDARGRLRVAREDDGVHYTRDGETLIACKLLPALPGIESAHDASNGC